MHLYGLPVLTCLQVGTWAGNLMLTHDHENFPSDVFTVLAAAGAMLTVGKGQEFKVQFPASMHDSMHHPPESATGSIALNLWDFISYDMKGVVSVWRQIPLKFLTCAACMSVTAAVL